MKILLMTTGGTFGQVKNEQSISTFADSQNEKLLSKDYIEELILSFKDAPKTEAIEKIDEISLFKKDSSNIIPEDWGKMVQNITEKYDDYHAFIIVHGTNTLGYTCAALSFALGRLGKPVVLIGSQIPYGYPGSDAKTNFENALRVVTQKKRTDLAGVMVIFGSQIISGARVEKTTEFAFDAFRAFFWGTLGVVGVDVEFNTKELDEHLQFLNPKAKYKSGLDINDKFSMDEIIVLNEFPGMTSDLLKMLVDSNMANGKNVKGIILRSTGAGDPNVIKGEGQQSLNEGFQYLQEKQIPIIVATQSPDGVASMEINEPGYYAKESFGVIPAWDMSIEAATIKLAWLIAQKFSYERIRSMMIQNFRGEVRATREK
jgi:L-asparaginase